MAMEMSRYPDRIGPYRLLGVLGLGGMGVVYRAEHERTREPVALKSLVVPSRGLLASLRREIHVLSRLQHPGIGSSGIQVGSARLSGYLWHENIGWISLSCESTHSCATVEHGIHNDGTGRLSGHAWAQNAGWIVFDPTIGGESVTGAGVQIDAETGRFVGLAWSETLGWLRFGFAAPELAQYELSTARCMASATPSATATPTGSVVLEATSTATAAPSGSPTSQPTGVSTPEAPRVAVDGPWSRGGLWLGLALIAAARSQRRRRAPGLHSEPNQA
jgi:hypothetical protein